MNERTWHINVKCRVSHDLAAILTVQYNKSGIQKQTYKFTAELRHFLNALRGKLYEGEESKRKKQ
jgi:hypothetical protein